MNNKELLKDASDKCLKNAKQLIKDADLLFSFRSYGSALALVTVGNEELGKAVIYKILSENFLDEKSLPNNYHQFLKDGKFQLLASESWGMGLALASCIQEFGELIFSIIGKTKTVEYESEDNPLSSIEKANLMKFINKMGNEMEKFNKDSKYKTMGLHVNLDIPDGKVHSPDCIEKSEVEDYIIESKERIGFVEPFFSLELTETQKKLVKDFLAKTYTKYHFGY